MKEKNYTYMQDTLENSNDWWMQGRIAILSDLIQTFNLNKGASIVDIGAGSGIIAENLKTSGYMNISTIDPSDTSIKILRGKKLNPLRSSLPALNNISTKYDLVLLLDVLEHIKDDKSSINAIYRILNNNGLLLITVPAFMFLWTIKDNYLGHYRRYSKNELEDLISSTPFKIEFISYFNFFLFLPALFYSYRNRRRIKTNRYSKVRNTLFTPIFKIERYVLRNYLTLPFGVSLLCVLRKSE